MASDAVRRLLNSLVFLNGNVKGLNDHPGQKRSLCLGRDDGPVN